MSNTFAAISFFCFVAMTAMAALVYGHNPKSAINRSLAVTQSGWAAISFIEFGYRNSPTFGQAKIWWAVDVFWPLVVACIGYFVLFYTERHHLLKKWATHVVILLPALIVVLLGISTDFISGPPIHRYWGWACTYQDNWPARGMYIWLSIFSIACFILTAFHHRKADNIRKRKRSILILCAGLIGVSTSILDNAVVILNVNFPSMFGLCWTAANALMVYAVWKYDMSALSLITAADNIVSGMADCLFLINTEKKIASANTAAEHLLEYPKGGLSGVNVQSLFDPFSATPSWITGGGDDKKNAPIKYIDARMKTTSGRRVPIWLASSPLYNADGYKMGYMMLGRDTTERNRREQELRVFKNHLEKLVERRTTELAASKENLEMESIEREKVELERQTLTEERSVLQQQLYHAQKLESIGRLAGGVAHDFNNLLFVINTYIEGFLQKFPSDDPAIVDFREIYQAARRATVLTQQLLAFSRKQIVKPKVVNLNESIQQLQRMLGRLLGENIRINMIPEINIGQIMIDPGQLDQVLMNLAVNAKDAMPFGGIITVRTNRVIVDRSLICNHEGIVPGPYVVIHFSDTGCGMDEATITKIFDPFFSTKGPGKGTGLGLSTVYGIVKQNGGFIDVDSKMNEGTTFSIYFPQCDPEVDHSIINADESTLMGNETILLVEDDEQVRKLASRLLRKLGYKVIEASGAGEASRIFFESRSDIDLLFTDVVMPGMNGKQLSQLLETTKPRLKVLFMSGYNEEIADKLGNLDKNTHFIAKPFSPNLLSQKIRQVLDA